jgi:methionine-S-sulfoxide reductase
VGYAGGTTADPTYEDLGDHSETVQVDYDPAVITYEELLAVFFASHDASANAGSRQYMSAIFYHDAEQERLALAVKAAEEARLGTAVQTQIIPLDVFYLAEDYHQKYALQNDPIVMAEFRAMYPEFTDIVDSTAVTRANAYLDGAGTLEQLQRELSSLGLSAAAGDRLAAGLE